ncbi:MAG: S8 family peptidase [Bacteroidetes bacterium]|nr:S8 family peptidase [Bacteroidota bacterium]
MSRPATLSSPRAILIGALWLTGIAIVPLAQVASAQSSARPAAASSDTKFWVFFADKPDSAAAAGFLTTSRASNRRLLRSRHTEASVDLPVNPDYIATIEKSGASVAHTSRWLNAVSAYMSREVVRDVVALPFVTDVRPVASLTSAGSRHVDLTDMEALPLPANTATSAFDYGASFTQLNIMNAIDPIEQGYIGTGIVLGFLDTEYDTLTHPVFADLVADNRLLGAEFFTPGPQSNRHGLSVASVAVGFAEGQLIGPAYGASVLLATTEYQPTETNQEEDAFVAGLEWLESQGVDVVNTSLGYTTFDPGQNSYTTADLDGDTGITTRAVDIAASLGVLVVTSAGNDGCSDPASCWYYIGTPADADSVVSVGAVTSSGTHASFSSYGPTADGRTKPEVAAMGQSVRVATQAGYASSSGTSFASPLAAAVACQVLQANPDLTPMQVRQVLMQTASQATSADNSLGSGILNAAAAVELALSLRDTSVADDHRTFVISGVFPNPVRDDASLSVNSSRPLTVEVQVFDITGRLARSFRRNVDEGLSIVSFPVHDLSSGAYFARVVSDGELAAASSFVVSR